MGYEDQLSVVIPLCYDLYLRPYARSRKLHFSNIIVSQLTERLPTRHRPSSDLEFAFLADATLVHPIFTTGCNHWEATMTRKLFAALTALCLSASTGSAQCTLPNQLTNGQNADAAQVMANFNAILNCSTRVRLNTLKANRI
jgi:hypothetical protein